MPLHSRPCRIMEKLLPPFRLVLFSILIAAIFCSFTFVSLSQTENSALGSGRKLPAAKTSAGGSKGRAPEPKVLHAQAEACRLRGLGALEAEENVGRDNVRDPRGQGATSHRGDPCCDFPAAAFQVGPELPKARIPLAITG